MIYRKIEIKCFMNYLQNNGFDLYWKINNSYLKLLNLKKMSPNNNKRKLDDSDKMDFKKKKSSITNSSSVQPSNGEAEVGLSEDGFDQSEEDDEIEYVWRKIPYTDEKFVLML